MTYLIKANLCTCKWSTIRIYKSNSLIKRYFLYLEETTQVQISYIKRNIFYNWGLRIDEIPSSFFSKKCYYYYWYTIIYTIYISIFFLSTSNFKMAPVYLQVSGHQSLSPYLILTYTNFCTNASPSQRLPMPCWFLALPCKPAALPWKPAFGGLPTHSLSARLLRVLKSASFKRTSTTLTASRTLRTAARTFCPWRGWQNLRTLISLLGGYRKRNAVSTTTASGARAKGYWHFWKTVNPSLRWSLSVGGMGAATWGQHGFGQFRMLPSLFFREMRQRTWCVMEENAKQCKWRGMNLIFRGSKLFRLKRYGVCE